MHDVTSDAQDFVDEYDLTYPQLRDEDGSTQEKFGVIAYPETLVIDREGQIVATRRGEIDEQFLRTNVLPLLGGRS